MARLFTTGFELQSASNGVEFDTANGTAPTIQTTTIRSGAAAMRTNPSAATSFITHTFMGTGGNNTRYIRVYLYIATTAGANGKAILLLRDNTSGNGPIIQLNTDRSLTLWNAQGPAQIGSNSSALSLNTWYRIELSYTYSDGAVEARIDGSTFASGNSTASLDMNVLRCGVIDTDSSDLYWDDIAVNDSTGLFQNSWPGSGKVIRLKPDSSGDSNTFATQTGGTAGSSNNYTRLNETPPDDATTFNGSSTLNEHDLVNFGSSGIGASDTVNVVEVWGRFRNSTADATAGIKFEVEKTGSGTISQSSELKPNSTIWRTNSINGAVFRVPPLVTYQDPDSSAWTQSTLDTAQAGYKLTTAPGTAGRRIDVSSLSLMVDYTPASGTLYTQSLSSTYSTSGNLTKQTNKVLSATYSASGSLISRAIIRALTAVYSASGVITRAVSCIFTANYSTSGVLSSIHRHFLTLTAAYSTSGTLTKRAVSRTLAATYSASGLITNRAVARLLTATYSARGSLSRLVSRVLSATYSASGVLSAIQSHTKSLSGTYSASGLITARSVARTLTATYSASGLLASRTLSRLLTATYSASGILRKQANRLLTAAYRASGLLTRQINKLLTATYSGSGTLKRATVRILTGTYSASASLLWSLARLLSGAYSASGILTAIQTGAHSKLFTATYSATGTLQKKTARTLQANYVATASLIKNTARTLVGGVYSASGSLVKTAGKFFTATYVASGFWSFVHTAFVVSRPVISFIINTLNPNRTVNSNSSDGILESDSTNRNLD